MFSLYCLCVVLQCFPHCVVVVVVVAGVVVVVVVARKKGGGEEEEERSGRCRNKNKNPTTQCGEKP